MFDYSMLHWTAFVTAAVLLNLSPGPDIAFILGQTVRGGRRAGFAAMAGIWAGALVHVGFAAVGLSAILASSARRILDRQMGRGGLSDLPWAIRAALSGRQVYQWQG